MSVEALIEGELAALGGAEIRLLDVHSHTGADIDGSTRTADEHVRDLESLDGRSVIFPFCVRGGYEAENRRVVEEGKRFSDKLVPFARLDPKVSGAADAASALDAGARGFKLHPRSEVFPLAHPNVDAIFGVAGDAGVPILIHAGVGVGSFGATIVDLAERHRGCPVVLAHAGISDLAWLWREVPDNPNLFFDTAWLVPADLLALFALVPPGRILYGSDAPFMDIELLLAITLRCARFTGLPDDAIALVVGGQLERLLAGEAPVDAGPAPGAPGIALSPADSRIASLLSAAGGCMLGGGDPAQSLDLALLASADDPTGVGSQPLLAELVEEARSGSEQAVPALVLAGELLERDDELATIAGLLDAAVAGNGGLLTIEGEAGAGKTSLLGAAMEMAARRGMLVLRARGGEYERDFPYGVVRQLFEPVLRDRGRRTELLSGSAALAGPVFEPDAVPAEGGAIEHGLYWLAADLAATEPMLLVVDDAQWCRSVLAAGAELPRPAPRRLAHGNGRGSEERRTRLPRATHGRASPRGPRAHDRAVAALDPRRRGPGRGGDGSRLDRELRSGLLRRYGRQPLPARRAPRALRGAELEPSEESVECLTQAAAAGVSHSIRTRLARLGEQSIEVARAVAVLEPNGAPRLVAALTGISLAKVTEAGEGLIAARLLGDTSSLAFVHPLVRDAVLTELSEPRRAVMHAQAARLLAEDGFEVDAVAAHLLLAEPTADEWAVARLRSAAAAALGRDAADAAVRYLRRALREPPVRAERLAVSRELGVALLQASDPEGIEVLRTVRAATSEVESRAAITNELASSLGLRNGNEEATGLIEESLSELPDPDGELGLMLRGWLLVQVVWGLERVPENAIPPRSPSAETLPGRAVLQGVASLYALGFGSLEQARLAGAAAIANPETLYADAMAGLPPQGSLVSLALADRGGEVAGLFDFAIEGSRRRGVLTGVGGGHGIRAFAHLIDGDLREAQADSEIAVDVLRRFELVSPLALWSAVAMRVLLRRESGSRLSDCSTSDGPDGSASRAARGLRCSAPAVN